MFENFINFNTSMNVYDLKRDAEQMKDAKKEGKPLILRIAIIVTCLYFRALIILMA